jgi:hypothetical protein
MGSPPNLDKINWYATEQLQVVLCICGVIFKKLKEKHGKVEEQAFWRQLTHHIPHVVDYLPEEHRDQPTLPNCFKQRGDKLNRYSREHPLHPSKIHKTGRYWAWANERFDSLIKEFTLNDADITAVIIKYNGSLAPKLEFSAPVMAEKEKELIDLNELLERIEQLETEVEELQDLDTRITQIENLFKRH